MMNKGDKKINDDIIEDEIDSAQQNSEGQSEELEEVENREDKQAADAESFGEPRQEINPSTRSNSSEQAGSGQSWEEKYKRALADYQNLEKRTQEYRREWIISSNRELLLRILPVLDTLMLAKKHSDDKSLEVTVQQFINILKSEGITKIETEGQDFNPHLMEAVATDAGEEGKVLEEIQTGYLMNDKLLRPALVKVGKGK